MKRADKREKKQRILAKKFQFIPLLSLHTVFRMRCAKFQEAYS
jgi:hypothetical protein